MFGRQRTKGARSPDSRALPPAALQFIRRRCGAPSRRPNEGHGHIFSDDGAEPSGQGDVVHSPRGAWHGFNNTSDEDVVLVWGWMGAGSIEDLGYEVPAEEV